MNLMPTICQWCNDEMPLTAADRVAAPMFFDMTMRLHVDVCPGVDVMAELLVYETTLELWRAS